MTSEAQSFFSSVLSAGAILTGFCGTFLSFRIQREANYYRQPVVDFESGEAKDVLVGLTHFSSSFCILVVASLAAAFFGFLLPVLALSGAIGSAIWIKIVSGGLLSSLLLVIGYFWIELRHYNIVSNRLLHDRAEWGRQRTSLIAFAALAVGAFALIVGI
jgi:hypothetical protein